MSRPSLNSMELELCDSRNASSVMCIYRCVPTRSSIKVCRVRFGRKEALYVHTSAANE